MIDSFPYDAWLTPEQAGEAAATFWTFGPAGGAAGGSLTGTFVMTALGMLLMVVALVWWVWLEHQKLTRQAEHLRRASGGL